MQVDAGESALDRRTLRFADANLEAEYRRSAVQTAQEIRIGPLVSVVLWLLGGVLAAAATTAPSNPIYAVALSMAAANGGVALLAPWQATYERQQLVGAMLQTA